MEKIAQNGITFADRGLGKEKGHFLMWDRAEEGDLHREHLNGGADPEWGFNLTAVEETKPQSHEGKTLPEKYLELNL